MQDNDNIYDDLLESMCFLSVDEFRYKLLNAVHNGFDVNYQREKEKCMKEPEKFQKIRLKK